MQFIRLRFSDPVYREGVICLFLSLGVFSFNIMRDIDSEDFSSFMINYVITTVYLLRIFLKRKNAAPDVRSARRGLALIIALIGAYALNLDMAVFQDSVDWFAAVIGVTAATQLLLPYTPAMPTWAAHTVSFLNGISSMTFLYLSIYLMPLYPVGVICSPALGMSLHVFVPLLLLIYSIANQVKVDEFARRAWISYVAALMFVVIGTGVFVDQWNRIRISVNSAAKNRSDLPGWVNVSAVLPGSFVGDRLLKSDLVYTVPATGNFELFNFNGFNNTGFRQRHDPLVLIAAALTGRLNLSEQDKINILQSRPQSQHDAERRLWEGDLLKTTSIETAIRCWPACNIAYTEKTIVVSADSTRRWQPQQEAVYTFQMPEGSVVSSLSLWIEGREEKAILTTQKKADRAYSTIVGEFRRDPSVVHWREGNTVSVRVFPILPGHSRQFKIGFTSPLSNENGKLRYENVGFKGPAFSNATERTTIEIDQDKSAFKLPASFISMPGKSSFRYEGDYEPRWHMLLNNPGVADCGFAFNGNSYWLEPYHRKLEPVVIKDVYLDVNKRWTRDEFDRIIDLAGNRNVYAGSQSMTRITETNRDETWRELSRKNFSLFPFHTIVYPSAALVVTRAGNNAPGANHLSATVLMQKNRAFFKSKNKVRVFSLDDEISPYFAVLKEQRAFHFDSGSTAELTSILNKGMYPQDMENDEQVIIHAANLVVKKSNTVTRSGGPDHVMRLFAYNHIMQQLAARDISDEKQQDSLLTEAAEANIVTPVSSLVVLESAADYETFDIKKSANTLGNATLQNKGAAPEPHEWVLIIMAGLTVCYATYRKKLNAARL